MFNIIENLQNCFTHELLPDCHSGKQAFCVVSCSEDALSTTSAASVMTLSE